MELLQLRYFLEVARTQHITKSAEKLHIAQPSLSQAIKRLENELGVPLFTARGRNIVLTEYGRFFRDRLEPLIHRLDALPGQLREMADPETATICLHVSAASLIVSEAIIEYRRLRPKTNFRFLLDEDAALFDVSISAGAPAREQIAAPENLFTCNEKICIAVPNSDHYRSITSLRLADLRDAGFISLDSRRQFRRTCDQLCAEAGFSPRIVFESDSPDTVRNMIAAHMGLGFWPAFSWGRPGDMKLIDITEPVSRRSIIIRKQQNHIHSQIVEDFFSFLCDRFMAKMTEAYGIG